MKGEHFEGVPPHWLGYIAVDDIDILLGNEEEITMLFGASTYEGAIEAAEETGLLVAMTRGPAGAVVLTARGPEVVAAAPVAKVVDTTGAGDLYAAGFLHGLTHDRPLVDCARLGSIAASEVISHVGARPVTSLARLARAAGFR